MVRIGLLSDTHGYVHPSIEVFFRDVNEIWHAGDIGTTDTADRLKALKPLFAVHGNIDDHALRSEFPEHLILEREGLRCLMLHIGGYPGNYTPLGRKLIGQYRPGLFISGHSHILKVKPDRDRELLHINPGAAGYQGLHHKITMVRFSIDGGRPKDLEVYETERRKL